MAEKIIKVRLFTWFENAQSAANPDEEVRLERINIIGDDVDISDEASLARGEELDAFFSDEDAAAIRDGSYDGPLADHIAIAQGVVAPPTGAVSAIEGEGPQTDSLSSQELGEYINENNLNVDETVALATAGDTASIEKVWDAEEHAAQLRGNDARKGVTDKLDAMLKAASSE
jgi:hypothetical protein